MFCREQAVQLHRERERVRGKGAELVFVGNGNRHFAQAFKDAYGLDEPLYVDTRLAAYTALGMKRGILRAFSLGGAASTWRALRSGARQGLTRGDGWQLGGVLVVRPGGQVAYEYLSEHPGDHPEVSAILGALAA